MLNGGLLRIRESLHNIKRSEQNAAHYILANPDEVIRLSIKELAERSESSTAAIIRMCKSIGVDGFQELKIRIAGDLQSSTAQDEYKEILPDADRYTLIESVSLNNILSLRETIKILDAEAVEQAIGELFRATRIDFYGVGASQLVAQDAQHKFLRINKMCTAHSDSHLQLTSAVTLTAGDVAVGISNSGETAQIITTMKQARKSGAVTIGITKYGTNSLAECVDIHLTTFSTEADERSAATSSRIAQLNVIDILFRGVAAKNYDVSAAYLRQTRKAVREQYK
ncbi:MurR/RpiR family transcriptional regulator [Brevibacillus porteri]